MKLNAEKFLVNSPTGVNRGNSYNQWSYASLHQLKIYLSIPRHVKGVTAQMTAKTLADSFRLQGRSGIWSREDTSIAAEGNKGENIVKC